ncbi:OLC1v1018680C1 [Oldenlandia corymbosa var. corymbosa]|uniref:OLC1v1018680C1 n=1 Tax=Oldenlandia corymbosa var. corymbosa TaxID=529605 RepID=A0AAV1ECC7_OLDCO|nr:OLC1v1018680C1 [Oldenlandia corymbosa var. corymbosa]
MSDDGGTVSLDPWTKKDKKDIETRRRDLEKLAGWKKTYTYRQIASLSDRISSRNQDEEEQYAEEGPQEVAPPETGATSSGQTTRTPIESSRRGSSSGRPSGHLKRKRGVSEVVEVDPLSFSLPVIHELSSLDDLLKEGYADPGRGTDLFEDIPAGHALLTFDPPRVECSELPETGAMRLEDGMRQAVQAVNTFVTVCAGLREQLASAQKTVTNGKFAGHECPEVLTGHVHLVNDVEEQNALVKGSFNFVPGIQFSAFHDVKAQQGVSMLADLAGPALKLEVASVVPSIGLPRSTLKFLAAEVSLEERDEYEEEESKKSLSVSGILKHNVLNGICTAEFNDENLSLRYAYKDEQMTFIPRVSLPSNALSFAFKRQFGPSDKLSYWYNFDSNCWNAVYKHTVGNDFKFKSIQPPLYQLIFMQ